MANLTARPAPLSRAGAGGLRRQERLAYTMLAPVLGTILVAVTYPFLPAVLPSLQDSAGREVVGPRHHATALANSLLYGALAATGTCAALVLPTEIVLGLGLALLVHRTVRSSRVRALLFVLATIPLVLPPIAV